MAKRSRISTSAVSRDVKEPRCLPILAQGITDARLLCSAMSALMYDLAAGALTSSAGNAMCNAAGKILKAVELQQKYGKPQPDGSKLLSLASE